MVAVLAAAEAIIVVAGRYACSVWFRRGTGTGPCGWRGTGSLRAVNQVGEINLGLNLRVRRRWRWRRSSGVCGRCRCARGGNGMTIAGPGGVTVAGFGGTALAGLIGMTVAVLGAGSAGLSARCRRSVLPRCATRRPSSGQTSDRRASALQARRRHSRAARPVRPARACAPSSRDSHAFGAAGRCPHERRRASIILYDVPLYPEPTRSRPCRRSRGSVAGRTRDARGRRCGAGLPRFRTGRHPWRTGAALPTNSSVGERRHRAR